MLASLLTTLFITGAAAIQVTSPGMSTVWSNTGSQTISWKAVSTDPDTFVVQLVNQQGFLTNSPVTLIQLQSTGSPNIENSASVSYPNGNWPTGYGFQINLMSTSQNNAAILAQSSQFNISSSGGSSGAASSSSVSSSSTSSSASSSTSSSSTTSAIPPTTITSAGTASSTSAAAAGGNASGGIPNAATTSSKSGASAILIPSVSLLSLVGVVAFFI